MVVCSMKALYSLVTVCGFIAEINSSGFGNIFYLNTPWPQSDLLALICAALEVSAPTPAITVNQPSTHCIINLEHICGAHSVSSPVRRECRNDGVMVKVK